MITKWLRPFSRLFKYSVTAVAGSTGYSSVCGYNIRYAVKGDFPNFSVDYERVMVGLGSLLVLRDVSGQMSTSGLRLSWVDNSAENDGGDASDEVYVLVYDVDKGDAVYRMGVATRGDGSLAYALPSGWAGDEVQVWVGARSLDGRLSNSSYVGGFTVV